MHRVTGPHGYDEHYEHNLHAGSSRQLENEGCFSVAESQKSLSRVMWLEDFSIEGSAPFWRKTALLTAGLFFCYPRRGKRTLPFGSPPFAAFTVHIFCFEHEKMAVGNNGNTASKHVFPQKNRGNLFAKNKNIQSRLILIFFINKCIIR